MSAATMPDSATSALMLDVVSAWSKVREMLDDTDRTNVLFGDERDAIELILDHWGSSTIDQLVEITEQMLECAKDEEQDRLEEAQS